MRSQLGVGHSLEQAALWLPSPSTNRGVHRVNMSDERFAEILNELQARGDKQKLMQLFGA
jgi:hypothetical protein